MTETYVGEASAGNGVRKWSTSNSTPGTSKALWKKPRKGRVPGTWLRNTENHTRKLRQFPMGSLMGEPREIL